MDPSAGLHKVTDTSLSTQQESHPEHSHILNFVSPTQKVLNGRMSVRGI
jgi:hypothetical protein